MKRAPVRSQGEVGGRFFSAPVSAIGGRAGGGGFGFIFQFPLLGNGADRLTIHFRRYAHQPRQARHLVGALAGQIEKLFADPSMAAEHVGQEREHKMKEAEDQESCRNWNQRRERRGLAVPEIPAGHEAAGKHADQAEEQGDAAEEFERLDVAHGAENDGKTIAGVLENAAGDAAFAVLAHAADF